MGAAVFVGSDIYRQAAYAAVGFVLMLLITRFDYSRLREWKLDATDDRINPNGSGISLGHPVGASGARVRNGNLIMVTSALPGEGKTFTSLNLALSIATEIDSTVLLVDGDVAHPSMPGVLGTPHGPGLLDLLTRNDLDFADALIKTNIDKLSVIPAGTRHRRSTELLASEQMASLLREMASRYADRIIIFDSPPLLATTEARVLASNMGQIVMVVAADATSQNAVNQALATIEACEVVLMVLNKASRTDVGTYYGYYAVDEAS